MKTIRQFNISVLIRGLIIPVILFATILGGMRLNDEIIELIDFGFNSKLATLSLTAGAFVRLENHDILKQHRSMSKIRQDSTNRIWLVLSDDGIIHQLHSDGSVSLQPHYPKLSDSFNFTNFAVHNDTIYTLNSRNEFQLWSTEGLLLRSDRISLREDATITVNQVNGNLAWGPDISGSINVTNRNLIPIASFHTAAEITLLDLAFNPDGNLILLTSNQELIEINFNSGDWSAPTSIACEDPDSCQIIHSISYQIDGSIWGLSEALTLISSSGVISPDFYAHPGYHDHTTELYLDYIIPMREIREKQHLTYLYTFILNQQDYTIAYVYDSSKDDDFTHIGYIDDELLLDDFIAATEVLLTSKAYVSSIKSWGQWGLVKIGFAPIYSLDGKAGAIMGADQNVTSISQVSREALVILTLNSFVFLLFGATASWFIARSLTAPLLAMKDNVLSIAAGFLDRVVADPSLRDLRPLASLFKEAGDNLKKEVIQGPHILKTFETIRREQDYLSYLSLKLHRNNSLSYECDIQHDDLQRIAYYVCENIAVGWILSSEVDSANSPNIHNGVYQLSEALNTTSTDQHYMLEHVFSIFGDSLTALTLLDATTNQILILRQQSTSIHVDQIKKEALTQGLIEKHSGSQIMLKDEKAGLSVKFSTYSRS